MIGKPLFVHTWIVIIRWYIKLGWIVTYDLVSSRCGTYITYQGNFKKHEKETKSERRTCTHTHKEEKEKEKKVVLRHTHQRPATLTWSYEIDISISFFFFLNVVFFHFGFEDCKTWLT